MDDIVLQKNRLGPSRVGPPPAVRLRFQPGNWVSGFGPADGEKVEPHSLVNIVIAPPAPSNCVNRSRQRYSRVRWVMVGKRDRAPMDALGRVQRTRLGIVQSAKASATIHRRFIGARILPVSPSRWQLFFAGGTIKEGQRLVAVECAGYFAQKFADGMQGFRGDRT